MNTKTMLLIFLGILLSYQITMTIIGQEHDTLIAILAFITAITILIKSSK